MARPERPVDPGAGEVQRFAYELRLFREKAGTPTYRKLAAHAGYSVTALSEATGGQRLPSLAVTLALVQACDGNTVRWEARWREALDAVAERNRVEDGALGTPAPYRGLAVFRAEDAEGFFGREALVADVVARVRRRPLPAVFGAPESGKWKQGRRILHSVSAGRRGPVGAGAGKGERGR